MHRCIVCTGQGGAFNINFESNYNFELITIDTSIENNIWEIGSPAKQYLNGGYESAYAIATDLTNPYPINNRSVFYLKIPYDFAANCQCDFAILSFLHKFDTDSSKDGGYVETSYDGGQSWQNIVSDSVFFFTGLQGYYKSSDTLSSAGEPGFSGRSHSLLGDTTWQGTDKEWNWNLPLEPPIPDSILIRFVFVSDSINNSKDGWEIDEILFSVGVYFGIQNQFSLEKSFEVFPNPFKELLAIKSLNNIEFSYQVIDQLGRIIIPKNLSNSNGIEININGKQGIYFLQIFSSSEIINLKLVKF